MNKRVAICTMGCKVNTYESQGMAELLEKEGCQIVGFDQQADVYLINTCTVTQIAARKSRQMIHRARQLNPEALIVAAGCYVDRDDSLIQEGIIDLAVPNRRKNEIVRYIREYEEAKKEGRSFSVPVDASEEEEPYSELKITKTDGRTRAFLKVQDGCRQFCTYCIIPYVRGPLRSKPVEDCVKEVEGLAASGYREVVLTGIHVTSYGSDLSEEPKKDMGDLIAAISKVEGIDRIRLSSLEPRLITPEFIRKVSVTDKLCPHFHLALQSGCDATLKAMNRKYTTDEFRQAVALLREHYEDVAITTDIIVGFPGETQEQHQEALRFVEEIGFAEAHVFPYSKMEGTVAARRKDQLSPEVKKQRSREMLDLTARSSAAFMESMQGKIVKVILEELDPALGCWTGYSPNYMRIGVMGLQEGDMQGKEISVRIDGYIHKRSANHDASGLECILAGKPEEDLK